MKTLTLAALILLAITSSAQRSTRHSPVVNSCWGPAHRSARSGPIMVTGGIALITAAVLENRVSGDWKTLYVKGQPQSTYVPANILTSFPQNILLGVGVGLTIAGLFDMKEKNY